MPAEAPYTQFLNFGINAGNPEKRCIVGAGLKMYLTYRETQDWLEQLLLRKDEIGQVGIFVLPTFLAINKARDQLDGSSILYGAQDTFWEDRGPFTGEVSPHDLRELGCTFVEVGHAERRKLFCDTDEWVGRKTMAIIRSGMVPIICVGESEKQAVQDAIDETISQVQLALQLSVGKWQTESKREGSNSIIIAYEPVWAIGVDQSAPVDHIKPVVEAIRTEVSKSWAGESAVLYGGSVNPSQANALLQTGVDGLFIGRAALNIDQFFETIIAVSNCEF
jgi:triosephosphate isomerase